jgi:hypothetical protein
MRESGKESGGKEPKGPLNRRTLLKGIGAVSLLAVGASRGGQQAAEFGLNKSEWLLGKLTDAQFTSDKFINEARDLLKSVYGIEVKFGESLDIRTVSDNLTQSQAQKAMTMLIREVRKYPKDFFKRNEATNIRIATNTQLLSDTPFAPDKIAGLYRGTIKEVLCEYDETNLEFFARAFHHEIYHASDWHDGGFEADDTMWQAVHAQCACNPYSESSQAAKENNSRFFEREYGATSPREDRATFAEVMMNPKLHYLFAIRMLDESEPAYSILLKKYATVRKDYLKWSNGVMNEAYWRASLAEGKALHENKNNNKEEKPSSDYMNAFYDYSSSGDWVGYDSDYKDEPLK